MGSSKKNFNRGRMCSVNSTETNTPDNSEYEDCESYSIYGTNQN